MVPPKQHRLSEPSPNGEPVPTSIVTIPKTIVVCSPREGIGESMAHAIENTSNRMRSMFMQMCLPQLFACAFATRERIEYFQSIARQLKLLRTYIAQSMAEVAFLLEEDIADAAVIDPTCTMPRRDRADIARQAHRIGVTWYGGNLRWWLRKFPGMCDASLPHQHDAFLTRVIREAHPGLRERQISLGSFFASLRFALLRTADLEVSPDGNGPVPSDSHLVTLIPELTSR